MMDHSTITGGSVDYGAAACSNSHMAAYDYNVAGLNIGEVVDPGITSHIPPAGGGDVALVNAYLVQTPVNEAGAVKGIGAFCSPHIRASQLGLSFCDESANAAGHFNRTGGRTAGGAVVCLSGAAAGITASRAAAPIAPGAAGIAGGGSLFWRFLHIAAGQLCHGHGAYCTVRGQAVLRLEGLYCLFCDLAVVSGYIAGV